MAANAPLARRAEAAAPRARTEVRGGVQWGVAQGLPRLVARTAARRGDLQARLIVASAEGGEPWAAIERLRAAGPVHASGLGFITVDHAVVKEVLASPEFRTGIPVALDGALGRLALRTAGTSVHPVRPPSMLVTEPPDHTRYRRLVTKVFTARAVQRLRERAEVIADELLSDMAGRWAAGEQVDLVAEYASLLPVTMITEILGVPAGERDRVLQLGSVAAPALDFGLPWSRWRAVESGLAAFDAWLDGHLAQLRRAPGDDLLSQLIRASDDQGALSVLELKSTAALVLAAGFETTVNLLGNGTVLLARSPVQLATLRDQPDLWPNAVEEVLRLDPPVLLTGRVTPGGATLAGVEIPPGQHVTTVLAGANRDPKVFAGPTDFDVARANAREHLSFSNGRHHCLGAELARMEGAVGLRALFERFPDLVVLPGARRRRTRVLRGWATLPVGLSPSR